MCINRPNSGDDDYSNFAEKNTQVILFHLTCVAILQQTRSIPKSGNTGDNLIKADL